jgi:hypothetical protein
MRIVERGHALANSMSHKHAAVGAKAEHPPKLMRAEGRVSYASSVARAAIGFGAAPPPGFMWNS